MSKVGRNDPCPCGSGKKYKKCCLQKDEEAERQRGPTASVGLLDRPLPSFVPPAMRPALSPEEQDAEKRWERFEAAGWEERVEIFRGALRAELLDGDEAFEMLNDLNAAIVEPEQREEFGRLLSEFEMIAPDLYQQDFGYYNVWLAQNQMIRYQYGGLAGLLEPFARDPERFPGEFAEMMRLLMYHGQVEPLLDAMQQAWPMVERSRQLMDWAIDEFSGILTALTIFAYLDLAVAPTADAPVLLEALGRIGERDQERDRLNVLSLLGDQSALPLTVDFAASVELEQIYDKIARFSLGWLGDLHRQVGIPFSRGELARLELMGYLLQRAGSGKRGADLLIPDAPSLAVYLREQLSTQLYAVYEVGCLLQLLPHYVEYLAQQGVLGRQRVPSVLQELRAVEERLAAEMKRLDRAPEIVRTVERAWRDTAVTPDGVICHDAADLDELLEELVGIGQYPDQDLMERIKARGRESIEPLIAIATDQGLHESDQESPQVWAPIHAIQLLGQMEVAEAVEPLLPFFDWDDDWLAMVLPEAFGHIGAPALAPMRTVLLNHTQEEWTRGQAAEALGKIGQYHPELHAEVVDALVEQLDQPAAREDDASVNGFTISSLVDLKAREAVTAIRRAFVDHRVDTMIITPDFAEDELGLLEGTME